MRLPISTRLLVSAVSAPALLGLAPSAWAGIYKCEVAGRKAEYQATPCMAGTSSIVKVAASPTRPAPPKPHAEGMPTAQDTRDAQRAQEHARQFPLDNRLSVDLPDTPLRVVLQVIADFAGYALTVDPSIKDTGSFSYRHLPASAILADLARRYHLQVSTGERTLTVARQ